MPPPDDLVLVVVVGAAVVDGRAKPLLVVVLSAVVLAVVVEAAIAVVVVIVDVVVLAWTSNDPHTLKPSSTPLSSLLHTSSDPVAIFNPSGPESPRNAVPPTLIKSNPVSTWYCSVLRTSGRNAFTLQLSKSPYRP